MSNDFASYLDRGEVVRWAGRPKQGLALRSVDAFLIPISLLWCGFAIFWEVSVLNTNAPIFMRLWGIPFVAVGLYLVFGRFLFDAFMRSRTQYALTDRRALILGGLSGKQLTEIDLRATSEIRYDINGSTGTISFGPDLGLRASPGIWLSTSRDTPKFFQTESADKASRIIRAARNATALPA